MNLRRSSLVAIACAALGSFSWAQAPYLAGAQYPGGTSPRDVRILDVNGDTKLDVLATSSGVHTLLGDGQGSFVPATGNGPGSLLGESAVGDVDGDGDLDVCAVVGQTTALYAYLGDGAGNFAAPLGHSLPRPIVTIALGRFDAGPALDLIVSMNSPAELQLLLGDGQGHFTPSTVVPLAARADQILPQDLDGDGDLDLILEQDGASNLVILRGNGLGGFTPAPSVALLGPAAEALQIHLDGDGLLDLVVSTSAAGNPRVEPFRADGTSLVALPATPAPLVFDVLAAGDVDGDGTSDLAAGTHGFVQLLHNFGGGAFGLAFELTDVSISSLALGDVDGDGGADLAYGRQGTFATVGVFLGDGAGGLVSPVKLKHAFAARDMVCADVDADRNQDIVLLSSGPATTRVSFYRGDGKGGFAAAQATNIAGGSASDLAVGRVDSDPYPDAITRRSYQLHLLPGGPAGFGPAVVLPVGTPDAIELGDTNGDGLADLFSASAFQPGGELRLSNGMGGTGGFGAPTPLGIPHGSYTLEALDVDGDDDLDLASFSRLDDKVSLLAGDGQGGFTVLWTAQIGGPPSTLAFVDVEGDHDLDIVVIGVGPTTVLVLDAQAGLLGVQALRFPLNANAATGFDIDADGWRELVASGQGSLMILYGGPSGLKPPKYFTGMSGGSSLSRPVFLRDNARPWIASILAGSGPEVWVTSNASPPSALGEPYCTAKTNSLSCVPKMSAQGISSASASSGFTVMGANVRNQKPGLLFYGSSGRLAAPFQGGTLCIAPPIKRSPAVTSGGSPLPTNDCSGVWSLDMNAFAAGALGGNPQPWLSVPGTIVDCQFWGRDPGPIATSLTDAYEYSVGP